MKKILILLLTSLTVFASEKISNDYKYKGAFADVGANGLKEVSKSVNSLNKTLEVVTLAVTPVAVQSTANVVTASQNVVTASQNLVKASQTIGLETLRQAGVYGAIAAATITTGYAGYRWLSSRTPQAQAAAVQAQLAAEKAKEDLAKIKAESEHKECLITNKNACLNAQGIPVACEDTNTMLAVITSSAHAENINDSFRKSLSNASVTSTTTKSSRSIWSRMTFGFMSRK